jgi:5'-nucleotidase
MMYNKFIRIYIDMDGVLCDYENAYKKALIDNPRQNYPQSQWGFFLKLEPINGAIESFKKLSEIFDVWILTKPSTKNVNCYSEKAQWVLEHLGHKAVEKLIFSCDKTILKGNYLIDDHVWDFDGEHIHFGTEKYPDWNSIINYITSKEKVYEIS